MSGYPENGKSVDDVSSAAGAKGTNDVDPDADFVDPVDDVSSAAGAEGTKDVDPVVKATATVCHTPGFEPDSRWARDLAALEEGVTLLFTNQIPEAEAVFKRGTEASAPAKTERDLRPVFAINWTLVSLVLGLCSYTNDQLNDALMRVWTAERLASEEPVQWVGTRLTRGISFLLGGVVQVLQHSWVKAGLNIFRAYRYIATSEEGLTFEGPEAPVIRSGALFTLGTFNFVVSMLPPTLVKIASFAGGGIQGDRMEALRMLENCHREEGLLAPWAAILLVFYYVSLKPFLGESDGGPAAAADFLECERLLTWARAKYPGSGSFLFIEAELRSQELRVAESFEALDTAWLAVEPLKLPAIELVFAYRRGLLSLVALQWAKAAEGFERCANLHMEGKRRSWIPTLSYLAALCRLVGGELEEAQKLAERVDSYKAMKKRNWPPEDELAFRKMKELRAAGAFGASKRNSLSIPQTSRTSGARDGAPAPGPLFGGGGTALPFIEILEVQVLLAPVIHTTPDIHKHELLKQLREAEVAGAPWPPEDIVRISLMRTELLRLLRNANDEALAAAKRGLEIPEKRLDKRGVANGSLPALHHALGLLHVQRGDPSAAEESLKKSEACQAMCRCYDIGSRFKRIGLRRRIAVLRESQGLSSLACGSSNFPCELSGEDDDEAASDGFVTAEEASLGSNSGAEDFEDAEASAPVQTLSPRVSSSRSIQRSRSYDSFEFRSPKASGGRWRGLRRSITNLPRVAARKITNSEKSEKDQSHQKVIKAESEVPAVEGTQREHSAVDITDGDAVLETDFQRAAAAVQVAQEAGKCVGDSGQLMLLGALHQQAVQGDCSILSMPQPKGRLHLGYLKWVYWSSLRGTSQRDAKTQYLALARRTVIGLEV